MQVGNLATAAHDRAHFGAWAIISAPLYLSFDLRDKKRMDRVWSLVTNKEALAVNQQYAGHPGRLVRHWTPTSAANSPTYAVTADLNSCQQGWSYNKETLQVSLKQAQCTDTTICGCLTVPKNTPIDSICRMVPNFNGSSSYVGSKYCDDANLVIKPCDAADPAQRFDYTGEAGVEQGFLSSNVTGYNSSTVYVRVEPWWEGAGVQLATSNPRPLLFNLSKGGVLQTGSQFAGDTCINVSPTMNDGDALMLWAKPQPGGAVAVLLVNNHPRMTFADVEFSAEEVGIALGAGKEAKIRDIWGRVDSGQSQNGRIKRTLSPRDTEFMLLTLE